MFKALLKKQMLAFLAVFTMGKNGKKRSTKAAVAFALLMVYAFGCVGLMFWEIADMLCKPLSDGGMAWVYFALMGAIATGFGVIGGIFTAKARLYEAKDNDLLLSMPIPSWAILLVRSIGLYLFTALFEWLVFIPALIRYFTIVEFSLAACLCSAIVILVLPLLGLAVCYLLGWLIALVSSKIPMKNTIELVFALAFMVAYFALYTKINDYLTYLLTHGEAVGRVMKTVLYPFSQLGYACEGKGSALLLCVLIFGGVFALIYLLMSATYLRLATSNRGGKKVKYTGKGYKGKSVLFSLVCKELLCYCKNSMVLLNTFLGTLMFVLLPVFAAFKGEMFTQLSTVLGEEFPLVLAAFLCVIASTNLLAPSSVSMEGEGLDVVRVLPVSTKIILYAKGMAHLLTTTLPALLSCVALCILLKQSVWICLCIALLLLVFTIVNAGGGIIINLLLPNLKWTNAVAVVKQSASTLVAMFCGIGEVALLVGGYFLFGKYLPAWGYMLVCSALLFAGTVGIVIFLNKKGVKIFEGL